LTTLEVPRGQVSTFDNLVCFVYKKAYQQIRVSEGSGSAYQGIRTIW